MGKLVIIVLVTAALTALAAYVVVQQLGFPIVRRDETETSRRVKRFAARMLMVLTGTAVTIFCLFLIRAAWDLVT